MLSCVRDSDSDSDSDKTGILPVLRAKMKTIKPEVVLEVPTKPTGTSRHSRKYPGCYRRYQVAKMLKRGRGTLNFWDSLLLIGNPDYRKNSLGHGKPWNAYQVELLTKISEYQYRGQNPQAHRDEEEIMELISLHKGIWTEENWQKNYSLPILEKLENDHNNQRTG